MRTRSRCFDSRLWRTAWLLFGLLSCGMAAVCSQAADTKQPAESSSTPAVSPERMPLLERQSWALDMLGRLDRANRVILDPEHVALQRKRFEALAQPLVLGTSPDEARKTVRAIRDEVEKSEHVAIEHLDRQFRQSLAETFRRKPDASLQRRWFEGWQKTVEAWEKSDHPTDRLPQLIDWLEQSRATLEGASYTTITPVPSFSGEIVTKAADVVKDTKDVKDVGNTKNAGNVNDVNRVEKKLPAVPAEDRPDLDVNLPELAAQISGNNLALRRIEAKLAAAGQWDAEAIDPVASELKEVVLRLRDAEMVYRLLSPRQRRQVDKVIDSTDAIKSLRSKIRAARIAAFESQGQNQDPSKPLTKEQRAELEHLNLLSDDLDTIDPPTENGG